MRAVIHEHVNTFITCDGPGLSIVSLLESSWVSAAAGCSCTGLLTNDCWVELDASLVCGNVVAAAFTVVTLFVVDFR